MVHDPDREPPFFFQKNANNLDASGQFPYPPKTSYVHYEIEMAVMLKSGGTNIPLEKALEHVYGYALSLDMTRRDLQGVWVTAPQNCVTSNKQCTVSGVCNGLFHHRRVFSLRRLRHF